MHLGLLPRKPRSARRADLRRIQPYNNIMNNNSLSQKRQWLLNKGYKSARNGSPEFIESLYGMYHKKTVNAARAPWKVWAGTNRPHHLRRD